MTCYTLIANQLSQSGLNYEVQQLSKSDIVEYMVLEAAGALYVLKGTPIKCFFRPGHTSTIFFQDNKKHSSLEFRLETPSISKEEETHFKQILRRIEHKFPESAFDHEHQFYNFYTTQYAVILPDENIEHAIKSSSLFRAAGNLSELDLESLLLLRKKLKSYIIADDNLSALAKRLIDRVNLHLAEHFEPDLIEQISPTVKRKFAAMVAVIQKEYKFNQLVGILNDKLYELIHKGTKTYKDVHSNTLIANKDFNPNYSNVAPIAQVLSSSLVDAGTKFFNSPLSQNSFNEFKKTCEEKIKNAKDEFAKFRGWDKWYNELNPILKSLIVCIKAIGGIIAGLTVIPGVLTEIYSEQGYIGTFFNTKTDSLRKLEIFEENLLGNEGIFDELNKETPYFEI
ncbi:hypothetical protein OQJ18_09455 [Fluoribacter dumoffii]|uniref:hypothetical protein n=1 Tax=Fluoribacter dumoffii TaxID=463 RepID=UPI00026C79F6|nr:hypothetical protein [Fluoribacter dumoffii]MCW8386787.1 hypothetical protein [Fluoribacter dumoffii]MCW8417678.1 hypothetical protein [Fluoribacter dumoffii]MCW8454480.1 hypothetical protein [Fluoribacter dumoffii]MCW8461446.1 hypothetical protein [Fluoribacter dumoffii]MCW8484884.1 hypothetical protein [Fluoribacter dumoffii]